LECSSEKNGEEESIYEDGKEREKEGGCRTHAFADIILSEINKKLGGKVDEANKATTVQELVD
jgi:hypothetical protein